MSAWRTGSVAVICMAMLTGCCGTVLGDALLVSSKDLGRQQGEFVGNSSDLNADRREAYQLRDKSYKTICDRSSLSSSHPSAIRIRLESAG